MSIKPIDYKWRSKRGLRTRLVVAFTSIMIGFLIMLLFGCFHSKRPKKTVAKQAYIGTGLTSSAAAMTKPRAQSHIHIGEPRTVTEKKLHGSKKKAAALRSSQMRAVRAKRLQRDRERREQVAFVFQDVYPSDNGGVMWR